MITPPKESLGIHALPPDTHNGDQIQVEGKVNADALSATDICHLAHEQ